MSDYGERFLRDLLAGQGGIISYQRTNIDATDRNVKFSRCGFAVFNCASILLRKIKHARSVDEVLREIAEIKMAEDVVASCAEARLPNHMEVEEYASLPLFRTNIKHMRAHYFVPSQESVLKVLRLFDSGGTQDKPCAAVISRLQDIVVCFRMYHPGLQKPVYILYDPQTRPRHLHGAAFIASVDHRSFANYLADILQQDTKPAPSEIHSSNLEADLLRNSSAHYYISPDYDFPITPDLSNALMQSTLDQLAKLATISLKAERAETLEKENRQLTSQVEEGRATILSLQDERTQLIAQFDNLQQHMLHQNQATLQAEETESLRAHRDHLLRRAEEDRNIISMLRRQMAQAELKVEAFKKIAQRNTQEKMANAGGNAGNASTAVVGPPLYPNSVLTRSPGTPRAELSSLGGPQSWQDNHPRSGSGDGVFLVPTSAGGSAGLGFGFRDVEGRDSQVSPTRSTYGRDRASSQSESLHRGRTVSVSSGSGTESGGLRGNADDGTGRGRGVEYLNVDRDRSPLSDGSSAETFQSAQTTFVCPVCFDNAEHPVGMSGCNHTIGRECLRLYIGQRNHQWTVNQELPCPLCKNDTGLDTRRATIGVVTRDTIRWLDGRAV